MLCRLCRVTGRVQGVFYRASTREQALKHGLAGYAKNLRDGSVEVLLLGEPEAVQQVADWLWQGPPGALVSHVECQDKSRQSLSGFSIS